MTQLTNLETLQTPTWDSLFEGLREKKLLQRDEIPSSKGVYGYKETLTTDDGVALRMITETRENRDRRRVEVSPAMFQTSEGILARVADSALVITKYGNQAAGETRPEGHCHLDRANRWANDILSQNLTAMASSTEIGWSNQTVETTEKGQQIKHDDINAEDGRYTKSSIISGSEAGRTWMVYYPKQMAEQTLSLGTDVQVKLGFGLGFGIITEQGEANGEYQSPVGSTHYKLDKMELLEANIN